MPLDSKQSHPFADAGNTGLCAPGVTENTDHACVPTSNMRRIYDFEDDGVKDRTRVRILPSGREPSVWIDARLHVSHYLAPEGWAAPAERIVGAPTFASFSRIRCSI